MKKLIVLVLVGIVFYITCSLTAQYLYSYKVQRIISNSPQSSTFDIECESKDVNDLMQYSLEYTLNELDFKLASSGNLDITSLKQTKTANCIGYVTFYNAVLNKLLKDNHITNVKIQHARATINVASYDVHEFLTDPSFKNHDISIVTVSDGTVYYIDPSLSEMGTLLIFKQ